MKKYRAIFLFVFLLSLMFMSGFNAEAADEAPFYGYVRDLYERPHTDSKYQFRGDNNILYTIIKPYLVTDTDSKGNVLSTENLYSLRGGIGSDDNVYLKYYVIGDAFADAEKIINHYKKLYGANLNRTESIKVGNDEVKINVYKTIMGMSELLYFAKDSYGYSHDQYKEYLMNELGMLNAWSDALTEDDIEVMQTLAFWYVANSDEKELTTPTLAHIGPYPEARLSVNGDNNFGMKGYRSRAMEEFYTRFILKGIELGKEYKFSNGGISREQEVTRFNKNIITKNNIVNYESTVPQITYPYKNYYEVGPFELIYDGKTITERDIEVFDGSGQKIDLYYELAENAFVKVFDFYNSDGNRVTELLSGEKYYLRIYQLFVKNSSQNSEALPDYDADCIRLRVTHSEYKTCATYVSAGKKEQDLLRVSKQYIICTDEIFASVHSLKLTKEKQNSCVEDGYKIYACSDSNCEYSYKFPLSKTGHNTYRTEYVAATCSSDGKTEGVFCKTCNKYIVASEVIPSLGHKAVTVKGKTATCTKEGKTEGKKCAVCDTVTVAQKTVAVKGHTLTTLKAVAATCTKKGKTEGKKCTVCDTVTVAQKTVAAKSHSLTTLKAVAATCTKEGKTEGKKCTVCGTVTVAQKAVAKKAHTYKNVTIKANLTKNGKVESKCSCGKVSKTTTVYYPKTIRLSKTSYTYNGKVQTPSVTVKDSKGNTLKNDTDYTVKYESGRKSTGKYTVTITFKGKYEGTKKITYNILPSKTSKITPTYSTTEIKVSWSKVTGASGYKVELLNSKGKVVKSITTTKTSYTFKKLSKVTTYKIRVTAYKKIDKKAVYSSVSTTITTSTAPAKVTLSKVTASKKQATVAWKTVSGASGYEVQASTSKKFTSKTTKKVTIKKAKTTKTTIKKLSKGKKYYVKVKAYKTVGKVKIYSAWSSVKTVKVK